MFRCIRLALQLTTVGLAIQLAGCGTSPPIRQSLPTSERTAPVMAVDRLLPQPHVIARCFGQRIERYYFGDRIDLPPLRIELSRWVNQQPRPEFPVEVTHFGEDLLTHMSPLVQLVEGLRSDANHEHTRWVSAETLEQVPGLRRADAVLRINGVVQTVETTLTQRSRGWAAGLFGSRSDANGGANSQWSTAAVTLSATAVDPSNRVAGYGGNSTVRVVFERLNSGDRALGVSINATSLSWNDLNRTTHGFEPALRLAMTVINVELLARSLRIPANECLSIVTPTVDTMPLENAVFDFVQQMKTQPQWAARRINYLRASYGALAADPLQLASSSASRVAGLQVTLAPASAGVDRAGLPATLPLDPAVAALAKRGLLQAPLEVEYATLYANLWRVPRAVFAVGSRWEAEQQRRLEALAQADREQLVLQREQAQRRADERRPGAKGAGNGAQGQRGSAR